MYGNVASRNGYTFNYDDASNLRSVTGSATAAFNYDANNLRVSSVANGQATYSVYARNGDLLGEYDQTGAQFVIGSQFKEYAYLSGKLVAMRAVAVQAPIANAGAAQTVDEGTTVTLDGTGSTSADGPITAYSWTQIGRAHV